MGEDAARLEQGSAQRLHVGTMTDPQILVVDDDQALLDLMVRRLQRRGLRPDTAMDGPTAIALLDEKRYDLILTDLVMPGGLSGLDILRRARESDPHLQVIVVTGAAALDNAVEALNEGAFSYLTKPFDHLSVFDNSVTRALEYRRLIQDNLRLAGIQRRRGDMLEEEVTQRIQQMRRRHQDMAELLARLPVGILVADSEGRTLLSNTVADGWVAKAAPSGRQPVREFLDNLMPPSFSASTDIDLDDVLLQVTTQPLPPVQGKLRTLIVLQERSAATTAGGLEVGSLLSRLKPAIDWLAARPLGEEEADVVRAMQMQVVALERLMVAEGRAGGTSPLPGRADADPASLGGLPSLSDRRPEPQPARATLDPAGERRAGNASPRTAKPPPPAPEQAERPAPPAKSVPEGRPAAPRDSAERRGQGLAARFGFKQKPGGGDGSRE
jgi:DNA-binding response OmpR family regulator